MSVIKVMDELLANKIAAGEVVEKCASVVKELVENSIDAQATEIKIELIDAGTREIKVTDNGKGMDYDDAIIAFQRHATSKIISEDDLYRITTLGFRGEALASIASVSNITLKTSTGEVGTIVEVHGGKIINVSNGDARRGTTISVRDLFYNTPARLKHLKSLYSELASVTDYINKLSLTCPDIKFVLVNNGSVLLNTDGKGNLLKTISSIYGIAIAKKMLPVSASNLDYEVSGYISLPEIHRSSRNNMITLVNKRIVHNTELNKVINDSYHSYKPDNRYPIIVLNITVDPSLIDVNIHPTKMDIKFSKMAALEDLISKMIRDAISTKTLIPTVAVEEKKQDENKHRYEEMLFNLERLNKEDTFLDEIKEEIVVNADMVSEEDISFEPLVSKKERLPELYPVCLIHGTYIICQNELGMYLIDQHAAKERVNYEMYKQKMGNPNPLKTALLFPLTIELSNNDYIILKENLEVLTNIGFTIEDFGLNSIVVKEHPTWLPKGYENDAINRIIEVIIHIEKNFSIEKFNEKVATMLSCKMAIKANENITLNEMEALINDLRNCDNPFNCPHGRPTIIFYSKYDLEKLFKRSGF